MTFNLQDLKSKTGYTFRDLSLASILGLLIGDRIVLSAQEELILGEPTMRTPYALATLQAFAQGVIQDEDGFRNILYSVALKCPELMRGGWVKRKSSDFSSLVGLLPAGSYYHGDMETLTFATFVESDPIKIETSAICNAMLSWLIEAVPISSMNEFVSYLGLAERLPSLQGLEGKFKLFVPAPSGPSSVSELLMYIFWIVQKSSSFESAMTEASKYPQRLDIKPMVGAFYGAIFGIEKLPVCWIQRLDDLAWIAARVDQIHSSKTKNM